MIKTLHSYWAYLVLFILIVAAINALIKFIGKKEFHAKDFRISLFTLIVMHIQLLIGTVLYFSSDYLNLISEMGMGSIMKNGSLRSNIIEHPFIMILAVVLITIGYSKHKKKLTSASKFKTIAIFYTLALLLVLVKIPWNKWMN